jgi:hypothetical protein
MSFSCFIQLFLQKFLGDWKIIQIFVLSFASAQKALPQSKGIGAEP